MGKNFAARLAHRRALPSIVPQVRPCMQATNTKLTEVLITWCDLVCISLGRGLSSWVVKGHGMVGVDPSGSNREYPT